MMNNPKTTNMTAKQWLLQLQQDGILMQGEKNNNQYLHLQTPCKVHLTENATQQLREAYDSKIEKGGILVAKPQKVGQETHLEIDRAIFLTNISETPEDSYLADRNEIKQALKDTLADENEKTLPIQFHTHPTHSNNPFNEMFHYLIQTNTSQQDRIASEVPVKVGDINLLMPDSLVLCNNTMTGKMFIGFYNGLIAPVEFDTHKREQLSQAVDKFMDDISEWANEGNNRLWLIGGGILLTILIIRYSGNAIPLLFLLLSMLPMFINGQHGQPKYFAQITVGRVTIDLS